MFYKNNFILRLLYSPEASGLFHCIKPKTLEVTIIKKILLP